MTRDIREILEGVESIPALAKRAGVSVSTLRKLATGETRRPNLRTVERLEAALGEPFTCGRRTPRRADLTGRRFGRLVVTAFSHVEKSHAFWECRCDCGKTSVVPAHSLNCGCTASCGCGSKTAVALLAGRAADSHDGTQPSQLSDKPSKANRSGRRGVSWNERRQQWRACITLRRRKRHIGWFQDFGDAVKAREEAEEKYFAPVLEEFREATKRRKEKRT